MSTETQTDGNQFIHPIPLKDRYEMSLVGAFEHLPRNCVDNILVNPALAESQDPNLQKWFDPDFLFDKAAIFAIGRPTGHRFRLQTPTSNRAVMLQKDAYYYDEYGNGYGEISVKGTGITYATSQVSTTPDPKGFFGEHHALQEETVSNALSHGGARVGRVIAILPLRGERLLDWFNVVVKRPRFYRPEEELQRVLDSDHQPALVVRLQGTDRLADGKFDKHERYSETSFISNPDRRSALRHYTNNQLYGRAARLLVREMRTRGYDRFLEHYRLPEVFPFEKDLSWLDYVGQKSNARDTYNPSTKDLRSLYFLYDFFNARNYQIAREVSEAEFGNRLSIKNATQDVDLAGYWYDFETSVPGDQYYDVKSQTDLSFERHPKLPNSTSHERGSIRQTAVEIASQSFR